MQLFEVGCFAYFHICFYWNEKLAFLTVKCDVLLKLLFERALLTSYMKACLKYSLVFNVELCSALSLSPAVLAGGMGRNKGIIEGVLPLIFYCCCFYTSSTLEVAHNL